MPLTINHINHSCTTLLTLTFHIIFILIVELNLIVIPTIYTENHLPEKTKNCRKAYSQQLGTIRTRFFRDVYYSNMVIFNGAIISKLVNGAGLEQTFRLAGKHFDG